MSLKKGTKFISIFVIILQLRNYVYKCKGSFTTSFQPGIPQAQRFHFYTYIHFLWDANEALKAVATA